MGVTGLWRLVEPAGKPVPIETLENKVLAVDISIWLHQMVKGYQDAKGAPMANAHLLGLFQRLCKLLYYRIKPVFVFDGAFPDLKKETIAKRQDSKAKLNSESERLRREILMLLGKKTAVGSLLGKQPSPTKAAKLDADDDLFKLPALEPSQEQLSSESESEEEDMSAPVVDLHSIDINSDNFKCLPLREKHDLLIELKETRKMNSWGKLHELPKDSDNFADYQMNRLLKRRKVQECLEETEKEIGGDTMTLNELETLLNEEGINTNIESLPTKRIASNHTTRYLLISNVKQALEDARKLEEDKFNSIEGKQKNCQNKVYQEEPSTSKNDEIDDDLQKAIQMSLECADDEDKLEYSGKEESPNSTFRLDSDYSDSSDEEYSNEFEFTSAKAYIMQNSDFTSNAIKDIITLAKPPKNKSKNMVDEIIKELNQEVPLLPEDTLLLNKYDHSENKQITLDLSSSDDECEEVYSSNIRTEPKEIVIVNTTIEDSGVSASADHVKSYDIVTEAIKVASDSDQEGHQIIQMPAGKSSEVPQVLKEDSDSDEDFEEVPETDSVQSIFKPVVELNLEMKDIIEDDIFADVFESPLTQEMENKTEKTSEKEEHNICEGMVDANIVECGPSQSSKSITSEMSNAHAPIQIDNSENQKNSLNAEDVRFQACANKEIYNENENKTIENAPMNSETEHTISNVNNMKKKSPHKELTRQQLTSMEEQLQTDHENLVQEKSRLDRMGRNITAEMTKDAQELLQIFGIPYVVAPTEAEAQCAFLEETKLTDGTITDDSDIWLFGGKTVYKNFFNQKKHVVQFLAERIEKSFNLSREQLILLALLVGSDYTTGVSGVGPVTAMEILAAFSGSRRELTQAREAPPSLAKYSALLGGLQEFKRWVRAGKRTDDTSLRKKLKNVAVTDDFPSLRVFQAYMEPKIEKSAENFTWGEPDVTILREFTRKKFGWSQSKLDEILNPVIKRMEERKSQKSMQDYFKRKIEFQSLEDQMSKRVKAAVEKMGPKANSDVIKTDMEPPKKVPRKRKPKVRTNTTQLENIGTEIQDILDQPSTSNSPGIVKVVTVDTSKGSGIDIVVPKLARYQEIIPQREKDRMNVLQNKMKAIEVFRKTQLDKRSTRKRRINLPKEKADLSESDSD